MILDLQDSELWDTNLCYFKIIQSQVFWNRRAIRIRHHGTTEWASSEGHEARICSRPFPLAYRCLSFPCFLIVSSFFTSGSKIPLFIGIYDTLDKGLIFINYMRTISQNEVTLWGTGIKISICEYLVGHHLGNNNS
jgi:hypothetical protein